VKETVEVGQFCEVLDSKLAEYGVLKGTIVYVAGSFMDPYEDDPYLYRKKFVAAFVKDGHIQSKEKPFIVDAKRLSPVSKVKQDKFDAIKNADFGDKGEQPQAVS